MTFGGHEYTEYERFSPDKDWMPRSSCSQDSYVWLDNCPEIPAFISRSTNPDEELDCSSSAHHGLWLMVCGRSIASQRMKQMMVSRCSRFRLFVDGLPDRPDLGGWEALQSLRYRAWQRACAFR